MKRKRSPVKIIIAVVLTLLIIAVVLQIIINRKIGPVVKKQLDNIIITGSDSLYQYTSGTIHVNIWTGTASIADLHIYTDSNRYQLLESQKQLPSLTVELSLKEARVSNLKIWALLFSKTIDAGAVYLADAAVKLSRHHRRSADTVTAINKPIWQLIQPGLRSIAVGKLQLGNMNLQYHNADSATAFFWKFNAFNAVFNNIKVDSAAAADTTRMLFTKNIALSVSGMQMKTPDGLYALAAKNMLYSSEERNLTMQQFQLLPAVTAASLAKTKGHQQEQYKLEVPEIRLENFRLEKWFSNNELAADTLHLSSPDLTVSLDRNAPPNPESKLGKYPSQLLQRAPFTINIRQLNASDTRFSYHEKNNISQQTGKLSFTKLNGFVNNVSNDPAVVAARPVCKIVVKGRMLEQGRIDAGFQFDLSRKDGSFKTEATITGLEDEQITGLAKSMALVDVQSLKIQQLHFAMQGNERSGSGQLQMRYSDLDLLLNKMDADGTFNKRGFLSFFVNRLVLYRNNPMDGEEERGSGSVSTVRDIHKSYFNFIWKTMSEAALKIMLRPAAARKIEKRMENAGKK